jgi:hypothetical protein
MPGADLVQRLLDLVELERLDDRFDLLHPNLRRCDAAYAYRRGLAKRTLARMACSGASAFVQDPRSLEGAQGSDRKA